MRFAPLVLVLVAMSTATAVAAVDASARAEPGVARADRGWPAAVPAAVADTPRLAAAQVQRGEQWFVGRCSECHEPQEFSNEDFRLNWNGRPAAELFERIRTTMPDDAPGSLPTQAYADIVTYLASLNGTPTVADAEPADTAALRRHVLVLRAR